MKKCYYDVSSVMTWLYLKQTFVDLLHFSPGLPVAYWDQQWSHFFSWVTQTLKIRKSSPMFVIRGAPKYADLISEIGTVEAG